MSDGLDTAPPAESVAIIGMAGRFPGAPDLDRYWQNLRQGVESVRRLDQEALEAAGVPASLRSQPGYVPAASPLDGVDLFDASLFGTSPREAELMDPQQRLFLECAWEALESAGYAPGAAGCRVGVYAGSRMSDYLLYHLASHPDLLASSGALQVLLGNDKDYLATRTAYKLDLRGPGLGIQTACSTSLVATHLACEAVLGGECEVALAGGVTVRLPQEAGYTHVDGGILSRDGHCRPFDATSTGTLFGSGVGIVVLKRLDAAVADGDTVLAVIRGSAVNNDGFLKVGFTAPSVHGQEEVIAEALEVAGLDAGDVGYVEAHGTGTPLGDPIEVEALTRAFRRHTQRTGYCALGSVKSNFGHLEAAAGVAGLVKAVLALQHREIPPSLHFATPNPRIDFASSPFFVNDRLRPWKSEGPRRAGVSSFGIGGTNAHLVLEEAPAAAGGHPGAPWQLLTLSARSGPAVERAARRLADHLEGLEGGDSPTLADVAYTLRVGRRDFSHRRAAVVGSRDEAVAALRGENGRMLAGSAPDEAPGVAFLLPGQGAQHPGMGSELYRTKPVFREVVDRCAKILEPTLGLDLRRFLVASPGDEAEEAAEALTATRLAQPALFTLEYALARLWMAWGVEPAALLGHSVGEYTAACLAGVFSLEDALEVVAARGAALDALPPGDMLAVSLDEGDLLPYLPAGVVLAAVNGPGRTVASGPASGIAELARRLAGAGVEHRLLKTSHAFHSPMVEPALEGFRRHLEGVALAPPRIPLVSNVTGGWLRDEEATDPGYWVRHVREAVRFGPGVGTLLSAPVGVLLEVGPGAGLADLARKAAAPARPVAVPSLPRPRSPAGDLSTCLEAAARLWLAGVPLPGASAFAGERRRRLPLPTYPFERQRFWVARRSGPRPGAVSDSLVQGGGAPRFHLPSWLPAPLAPAPAADAGRWLLLADRHGLADEVAARIATDGNAVVRALPVFGQEEPLVRLPADGSGRRFGVVPGSPTAMASLLSTLEADGVAPTRIVHLWCYGPPSGGDEVELGFHTLHALARALAGEGLGPDVRIVLAASGLFQVVPDDEVLPERSVATGACRVLGQEDPRVVVTRSVDLPVVHGRDPLRTLAAGLLAEVEAPASVAAAVETADATLQRDAGAPPEPWVAYRGGRRWRRGFEPVELAATEAEEGEGTGAAGRLREGGVYLLTGGLGAVGLELAEELGRRYRARLILTTRGPAPRRESWEAWAAGGGGRAALASRLLAIEAAGARVRVEQADVADAAGTARLVETVHREMGPVDGVFHLAGLAGEGLLQRKERGQAEAVLRPKVEGSRVLAEVLDRLDSPPFLLLLSSTLALLGGPGQGDYAGANAFLAAFAESRAAADGAPTVAVVSGGWNVGMAATGGGHRLDHPVLERRFPAPSGLRYEGELDAVSHWVLDEHRVLGHPVLPGTALLELAIAAYRDDEEDGERPLGVELRDAGFRSPLAVPEEGTRRVQVHLTDRPSSGAEGRTSAAERLFSVRSRGAAGWVEHASGRLTALAGQPPRHDLEAIRQRCREEAPPPFRGGQGAGAEETPTDRAARVVTWGPHWDLLRQLWIGEGEFLARLGPSDEVLADGDAARFALHPAVLDVATSFALSRLAQGHFLPLSYGRLRLWRTLPERLYSHLRRRDGAQPGGEAVMSLDVTLFDEEGLEVAAVENLVLRRLQPGTAVAEGVEPVAATSAKNDRPEAEAAARRAPGGPAEHGLDPAAGVEGLLRALAPGLGPVVFVGRGDLPEQIHRASARPVSAAAATPVGGTHRRPELATPFVAPRNEVERGLANLWQQALGLEAVGVHDSFFELGGDSLLALRLVAEIRRSFGLDLPMGQLFETATVEGLAEVLTGQLAETAGGEDLDRVLDELEGLTDDEVEALLAEEEAAQEPTTEETVDG